jgi:hypothetical protein
MMAADRSAASTFTAGLAGACAVTAIHEIVRRTLPDAPRLDILGRRAVSRISGGRLDDGPQNQAIALAGDLVANSAYYGTAAAAAERGGPAVLVAAGLLAGLGAVLLPGPLGLGEASTNLTRRTQILTIAWYTAGAVCTWAVHRQLRR